MAFSYSLCPNCLKEGSAALKFMRRKIDISIKYTLKLVKYYTFLFSREIILSINLVTLRIQIILCATFKKDYLLNENAI